MNSSVGQKFKDYSKLMKAIDRRRVSIMKKDLFKNKSFRLEKKCCSRIPFPLGIHYI